MDFKEALYVTAAVVTIVAGLVAVLEFLRQRADARSARSCAALLATFALVIALAVFFFWLLSPTILNGPTPSTPVASRPTGQQSAASTPAPTDKATRPRLETAPVSASVADILQGLKNANRDEKIKALKAARKLGPQAHAVSRELCVLALSPDGEVKQIALEAVERVEPDIYPHAIPLCTGTFVTDLVKAGTAMGKLGPKGAPAVPILLHHLNANLEQGHLEALNSRGGALFTEALGKVGAADDEAVEWLFNRLNQEDRREAATRDREAVLGAIASVARERASLREKAIKVIVDASLGRFGQRHYLQLLAGMTPESTPTLRSLKINPDEQVRKIATQLLAGVELD